MDVELNNAVAATAIGAFLRRLRKKGRKPDRWEAEQTVRALAFLKSEQYRQVIDHVGRALLPPSKRDPAAVREIEKAAARHVMPSLATLQTILEEICNEFGELRRSRWVDQTGGTAGDIVCIAGSDEVHH